MTPAEKVSKAKYRRGGPRARHCKPISWPRSRGKWVCKIADVRMALDLSLEDVCQNVGITRTGLRFIELGENIGLDIARKLSDFFGKPIEELWPKRCDSEK